MKRLLTVLAVLVFVNAKARTQDICLQIKPFETYYDTIRVTMLVSETVQVYAMPGYEVYEHNYKKGRGWYQDGDMYTIDCDEHIKTLWCRLDENKKRLTGLIVWQVK